MNNKLILEACEAVPGAPRLAAAAPSVAEEPVAGVRWSLEPFGSAPGGSNFAAFPHMRLRLGNSSGGRSLKDVRQGGRPPPAPEVRPARNGS